MKRKTLTFKKKQKKYVVFGEGPNTIFGNMYRNISSPLFLYNNDGYYYGAYKPVLSFRWSSYFPYSIGSLPITKKGDIFRLFFYPTQYSYREHNQSADSLYWCSRGPEYTPPCEIYFKISGIVPAFN